MSLEMSQSEREGFLALVTMQPECWLTIDYSKQLSLVGDRGWPYLPGPTQ
jgi:hypothetical protein